MFLLAHAKDIWYIVLSLCAVTFTCFVAALLYYLVLAAKDIRDAAEGIKRQVDSVEEIINGFRTKVMKYVSYAAVAGEIAKKVTDFLKQEMPDKGEKNVFRRAKRRVKHDESTDFMAEEL